jgi:hypothetical protein
MISWLAANRTFRSTCMGCGHCMQAEPGKRAQSVVPLGALGRRTPKPAKPEPSRPSAVRDQVSAGEVPLGQALDQMDVDC